MELGFLQLKPTSISKDTSGCVASAHNMHSLGRSKQVVPRVCFIQKLTQDGIIIAQQCPAALQIPDIGTKALPRVPFRILYRSTSQPQARWQQMIFTRPLLRPCVCSYIQVRLRIHSSCFSWSRWCMCFVILLMCHICCIVAYTSLSSF